MSLIPVSETVPTGTVSGWAAPGFEAVAAQFVENFRANGEAGAGVCVLKDGETVVDLWGGSADPRAGRDWDDATLVGVFSCTKAVLAVIAHRLAEQGKLDLDAPVTDLWPEYGTGGKEATTTRMMLDHTAGVPAFREPVPDGLFLDFNATSARLAGEEAFFPPGTRSSYHGLTYAWTVGTMIRRADGRSAGQIFAEDIAGPLGLEFWIGLPEEQDHRVARILAPKLDTSLPPTLFVRKLQDKSSIPALFFLNDGGFSPNKRDYRAAEIGSANGITNARSLARFYGALSLGGTLDGVTVLRPETIQGMTRVTNASHLDATLCIPMRFGAGLMRSVDNSRFQPQPAASLVLSDSAFGHGGAGGSLGFADPDAGLAFGYVMNQMGLGSLLNIRGQSLVDAAYQACGYRDRAGGAWVR